MESKTQDTLPLAVPSPARETMKAENKSRRKNNILCCCGICCSIVILVIIILIILIFTVFKQKDPTISVDTITLQKLDVNVDNIFSGLTLSVDVDLDTKVSVKNPNYAGFKYRNTTAYIYYQGKVIGVSPVPAGEVKARKTQELQTVTSVTISGDLINANLTNDISAGVLPLVTTVQIKGTAKVLGFVNVKNVRSSAYCEISIYIQNQTESFHCDYKVKL